MYCNCLLTTSALRKKVWFLFLKNFLPSTQSPCQNRNFSILAGRLGTRLSFFLYLWLISSNYMHMYNFYRWYNVLFFTFFYGLLRPFNVITLLVFQSSLTLLLCWCLSQVCFSMAMLLMKGLNFHDWRYRWLIVYHTCGFDFGLS